MKTKFIKKLALASAIVTLFGTGSVLSASVHPQTVKADVTMYDRQKALAPLHEGEAIYYADSIHKKITLLTLNGIKKLKSLHYIITL